MDFQLNSVNFVMRMLRTEIQMLNVAEALTAARLMVASSSNLFSFPQGMSISLKVGHFSVRSLFISNDSPSPASSVIMISLIRILKFM